MIGLREGDSSGRVRGVATGWRLVIAVLVALNVGRAWDEVRAAAPSERGSTLHFYGWSRDSRLIAYTRQRAGRTRPDQRMHRFVEEGLFTGFGKKVGGDVERYARERGYIALLAAKTRISETRFEFVQGVKLVLELAVGQAQRWQLSCDGVVLAEHTFDRIYVGFDADLYPSPDGTQAVIVMHLDTGWEIDAAIFPVSLPAPPSRDIP